MASSPIQNWFESQINGGTHFSYCLCENEMKDAKVVELLRLLNLITRSLSLKIFNNPSTEDFSSSMIYICCPFFLDDFSFNISSVSDPFIFRLTWLRTSSWLRTQMYWDDGLSKLTEEKRLRKCIDFMTHGSFFSIDRSL